MSEPMTSGEIEDVLSSIRRLVSEDLRPQPRNVVPLALPETEAGKLMLTPALRVVSPVPVAVLAPVPAVTDLFDAPFRDLGPAGLAAVPEAFPEAEDAGLEADAAEDEPDLHGAGLVLAGAEAPRFGDFGFAEAIEEAIDSGEGLQALLDDPANALVGEAAFVGDDDATAEPGIETVVVALGAAVAAQRGEWEADGGDPQDMPADAAWRDADWSGPEGTDAGDTPADAAEEQTDTAGSTGQWAAEAIWAQEEDAPESHIIDMTSRRPAAPEIWDEEQQRIADLAEAAAVAEIMAATAATSAPRSTPLPDEDDEAALFDEEVLRDLVRDIIREELQGTLGERITRNVRKLVRAEISRALASRDFD